MSIKKGLWVKFFPMALADSGTVVPDKDGACMALATKNSEGDSEKLSLFIIDANGRSRSMADVPRRAESNKKGEPCWDYDGAKDEDKVVMTPAEEVPAKSGGHDPKIRVEAAEEDVMGAQKAEVFSPLGAVKTTDENSGTQG